MVGRLWSFRPFIIFPLISGFFFVFSTIVGYALYLGAFGISEELVLSTVLSVGCGPSLLGSFAPNVIELGYSLGFVSLAFLFLFKHSVDISKGLRPRTANWMLFFGIGLVTIFLFWMMSFPTGRGTPWDLFHQVTAGIGIFGALLYIPFDSFAPKRTKRRMFKRVVSVLGMASAVAMAMTYFILRASPFSLALSNTFASFQFVFMGFFFLYILLLTDGRRVNIK